MNLHIFFHGMMVFVEKEDKIAAELLKTPKMSASGDEHVYVLIPSLTGNTLSLKGDYTLQIDGNTGTKGLDPDDIVIFEYGNFSVDAGQVHARIDMPKPSEITAVRNCKRFTEAPFFRGADAPSPSNEPEKLPIAHVFSYCAITSAALKKGTTTVWEPQSGAQHSIIAIHAEEEAGDPSPDLDGHMRHVRTAIKKGTAQVKFHYVLAREAPDPRQEEICGTKIPAFWSKSLPEKGTVVKTTAASAAFFETNPCWRYGVRPGGMLRERSRKRT